MAETHNLMDYLDWRGDLSFEASPWNPVDGLIFALLSYQNLGEKAASDSGIRLCQMPESILKRTFDKPLLLHTQEMLQKMNATERFRHTQFYRQVNDVDPTRNIQFSAINCEVPHLGTVIAFRGTDGTVVGWKEDFMMSYESPVPAQSAALAYLTRTAQATYGPLYLCGHSKGGNLAIYAAIHADPSIRERIAEIDSYDGPGLDDESITSEAYAELKPRICALIPQGSIVGQLMNYYPGYTVVHSTSLGGISQHDGFSWQVLGTHFIEEPQTTKTSQFMDKTVHEWLKVCSNAERQLFVETIFSLAEKNPDTADREDVNQNLQSVADSFRNIDPETRKTILSLFGRLVSAGAKGYWESVVPRPITQVANDLLSRLQHKEEPKNEPRTDS